MDLINHHPASFRDPSGFIFLKDGKFFRQVNNIYKPDFDHFIGSGLYDHLSNKNSIVKHQQISENYTSDTSWFTTLQPEQLSFISYPYEWCFEMLRDAALLTLQINKDAINHGMILKGASGFNVQWDAGNMKLIDSLSFKRYDEKEPWVAYRQFCEHFLAPLAFMHYLREPAQPMIEGKTEGLPLKLVSKLLPLKSRLNLHVYLHIHLHASLSGKSNSSKKTTEFSRAKMIQMLRSLESAVRSLTFSEQKTSWSEYYKEAAQRDEYLTNEKQIIDNWVSKLNVNSALDVGSNEGEFSELMADKKINTISIDGDHHAINKLYNRIKTKNAQFIYPLVIDITRPSPAIGWNNKERAGFIERTQVHVVLALAIIQHLAIGKNIPLQNISSLFASLGETLIIEFVPKEDEKVQLMLQQREDVFERYNEEAFVNEFSKDFTLLGIQKIASSQRTLYLMKKIKSTFENK